MSIISRLSEVVELNCFCGIFIPCRNPDRTRRLLRRFSRRQQLDLPVVLAFFDRVDDRDRHALLSPLPNTRNSLPLIVNNVVSSVWYLVCFYNAHRRLFNADSLRLLDLHGIVLICVFRIRSVEYPRDKLIGCVTDGANELPAPWPEPVCRYYLHSERIRGRLSKLWRCVHSVIDYFHTLTNGLVRKIAIQRFFNLLFILT